MAEARQEKRAERKEARKERRVERLEEKLAKANGSSGPSQSDKNIVKALAPKSAPKGPVAKSSTKTSGNAGSGMGQKSKDDKALAAELAQSANQTRSRGEAPKGKATKTVEKKEPAAKATKTATKKEAGVTQPNGDPYEYKRDGDKVLTRKKGSSSWITANGKAKDAILRKVYKEGEQGKTAPKQETKPAKGSAQEKVAPKQETKQESKPAKGKGNPFKNVGFILDNKKVTAEEYYERYPDRRPKKSEGKEPVKAQKAFRNDRDFSPLNKF